MLDVGFDMRPVQTGHRFRGIGRYTAELYGALAAGDYGVRLKLLGLAAPADTPDGFFDRVGEVTRVDLPAEHYRYRSVALDIVRTPAAVRSMGVALMHFNMQVVPERTQVPYVVTVHDCATAAFAGAGRSPKEKIYFRLQARAARRAAAVITVSNASRSDIVRYVGVSPKKVFTIYEACADYYKPDAPQEPLKQAVDLPEKYLLYVGATDYRKNIKGLVEIYGLYCERARAPLPLVLTGKKEYYRGVRFTWPEGTHGGIVGGAVHVTGFLDEDAMPALYGRARVFIFPSLYEGFGLPALEAMACGAPVIAYDNSAVSEVVGRYGVLVPTGDVGAFVDALIRLSTDDNRRNEVAAAGLERSRHFSWSKAASETAEVYREVARCA